MNFFSILTFIIILLSIQPKVLNSQNVTCNPNDLNALLNFITILHSSNLTNWNTTSSSNSNCCSWEGITCESSQNANLTTARVVKLELPKKKLIGNLSDSLGFLDELKTLNLSGNFLVGSIPVSLFSLSKLETLDLSSNGLIGKIPAIVLLPSIQTLDISQNSLTGPIPAGLCNNSLQIEYVNLGVNYLTGNLPPAIGNCSSLRHFSAGSNYLTGEVSDEIFRLRKLIKLNLQDNMFLGEISSHIGNLSDLVRLDVSMNSFSGLIPNVFQTFWNLQYFIVNSNNFSGSIPSSLSSSSSLTFLNLNKNSFIGQIDIDCVAMSNLISLDLGSNKFSGPIPDNLPYCTRLKNINLAKNKFNSEIPESYKDFQSLSYLSLSNSSVHNISSALRILQQCRNLTTLVLTLNFAGGEVLPADPILKFEKLKVLIIASSRLSGSIPLWLSASTQLQLVDLSWNRLNGTIPGWFGDLKNLFYLDLSNNSFYGGIPKSLTRLESLINRSISLEEPSPDFPFFMKRDPTARGLQFNKVWSFPPTLDLGYNFLSGPIWPEFGDLKNLHFLDIKFNNLSGSIPSELSGMTNLEALDLSHNNLSGTIPESLVTLTFMSRFNVSYNNLHGKVPIGGQFGTFPNSSFEGNAGLCGIEHALISCESANEVPIELYKKPGRKIGTIVGMVIGIVFGTMLLVTVVSVIILKTLMQGKGDVKHEEDDDDDEYGLEQLGSQLVLFQNNGNNSKELTIDELLKSTNNFDQANIIGCGGFGLVYKSTLPDGQKVAIKRLSGDCGQMEREFQAEVEALSRAQHQNLVLLQGFCIYKKDRLLIYSYMENGSLDYWLHEKINGASSLDWETRLCIAQGSAKGLAYLHQSCDPHILHRDIKSSNILLDETFKAHLADFGLARLILSPYDTHITTDLVGTLGYIPPEYGQASIATYKGDIYSFGVVLLELITGKRPVEMCKPKGTRDMISWVIQMKKEGREVEVFDRVIYDKQYEGEMLQFLQLACLCLSENPKFRPSTQDIVSGLDEIGRTHV